MPKIYSSFSGVIIEYFFIKVFRSFPNQSYFHFLVIIYACALKMKAIFGCSVSFSIELDVVNYSHLSDKVID